jgi:hypothetical protein
MARFSGGLENSPHASLAWLATHFNMQTVWDTLLSSKHLSRKFHLDLCFLGEISSSHLSDPLDLQLKHFTDGLRVFIRLRDLFP